MDGFLFLKKDDMFSSINHCTTYRYIRSGNISFFWKRHRKQAQSEEKGSNHNKKDCPEQWSPQYSKYIILKIKKDKV